VSYLKAGKVVVALGFVAALVFSAARAGATAAPVAGEQMSIHTSAGAIELTLVRAADTKPHPAVIILHGRGTFDAFPDAYRSYAANLVGHGIDAYLLSYYSSDDVAVMRDGSAVVRQQLFDRRMPAWSRSVTDAVHAIQAGTRAPTRIGLLGFSNGGFVAVAAAAEEPSIAALAELYGGAPAFAPSRVYRLPPLLIVHGDADQTIPVSEAHSLARLAENLGGRVQVGIYPGVGHGFDFGNGPHAAEVRERVVTFLATTLRN
jgi:carboxymethylenebutenolidase